MENGSNGSNGGVGADEVDWQRWRIHDVIRSVYEMREREKEECRAARMCEALGCLLQATMLLRDLVRGSAEPLPAGEVIAMWRPRS